MFFFYVQTPQKVRSGVHFLPLITVHTIVSFLFPKEHRDFLSFLVLCDVGGQSGDVDDVDDDDDVVDKDEEREGEGDDVEGLELVLLHGELGAD